jgi:putative ABC transport system permease protein
MNISRVLRNVFYRKGRAFLTIFGIVIGVFVLVVLGAMAEKMTLLVDGGVEYYKDKVIVSEGTSMLGYAANPISPDRVSDMEAIDGVACASADLSMLIDEEMSGVNMGIPPTVMGSDMRCTSYDTFKISFAEGRDLTLTDTGKAVVGSDVVGKLGAEVGQEIEIRDEKFEVVGIMEKTLTAPDMSVVIPMADMQRLYHKTLPEVVRTNVAEDKIASGITVFVKDGYDPDELARTIADTYDELEATGPTQFKTQIANSVKMFSAIIYAIALISLIVGALSIINTMSMSIAERTREIGIRKAIGATDGAIIRQFLAESAMIGVIGGLLGIVFGWLITIVLNSAGNEAGTRLFLVTPRLVIGTFMFALVLGVVSGLYPARKASKLNPVDAIRYE